MTKFVCFEMRWCAGRGKVGSTAKGAARTGSLGRRQYLVRWAGHDTWEDEADVLDQELIQSFAAENDASCGGGAAGRGASRRESSSCAVVTPCLFYASCFF